jgi:Flp pilus assembly protein TadG
MVGRRSLSGEIARSSASALREGAMSESGVSAIEFALIAPVLIVMFMGLCDLCTAVMTQLHVDRAAEGTGDVTATYSALQLSDMADMFTVASQFLQPYSSTPLNVRITNVYAASDYTAKVYWSCSNSANLSPYAANATVTTTPTGAPIGAIVLSAPGYTDLNSGVIIVEISYKFSSPTGRIINTTPTMTSTAYLQPRKGLYIGFPWGGGATLPTPPNSTTTSTSTTLTNGATCNYRQ